MSEPAASPSGFERLKVRQKLTLMVNRYEILQTDATGLRGTHAGTGAEITGTKMIVADDERFVGSWIAAGQWPELALHWSVA